MRARDFVQEYETVPFQGLDISMEREDDEVMVTASAGGKTLGQVMFVDSDGYLMPQDLEVDERFRGQGIARIMYDYVKSQGYKIRRSGQQTDAGAGFWGKHRPGENVWESAIQEVNSPGELAVDPDLIQRFTDRGWEIDGEGRDQIVLSRPGSNTVMKIVGSVYPWRVTRPCWTT
jgi:predicted GNAT family acetyltransferase